jgi:hypothetical protein
MPVTLRGSLVHVSGPFLHQPLIDPLAGTGRNEAVPQTMQTTYHLEFGPRQNPLEMVMHLVAGQCGLGWFLSLPYRCHAAFQGGRTFLLVLVTGGPAALLASLDFTRLAEQVWPSGVNCEPLLQHPFKERRQRHPSGGTLAPAFLLFPQHHTIAGEVHIGRRMRSMRTLHLKRWGQVGGSIAHLGPS